MPEKIPIPSKAADIKKQLQATDRELSRLHALQWLYAKRLLKFGIIFWIFGMGMFFTAMIIIDIRYLPQSFGIWAPLLIIALVIPIILTAIMLRKFGAKIRYLERLRHTLLTEYERAILKRVEKIIVEG